MSLTRHYSFNNTDADLITGEKFSGNISFSEGHVGECINFGFNESATTPNPIPTDGSPFSVSVWVYNNPSITSNSSFLSTGTSWDGAFTMYVRPEIGSGNNDINVNLTLPDGRRWYSIIGNLKPEEFNHLCYVFDGVDCKLYLNNELLANQPEYTGTHSGTNTMQIGKSVLGSWAGSIDELMIFDHPLSGNEISNLYRQPSNLVDFRNTVEGTTNLVNESSLLCRNLSTYPLIRADSVVDDESFTGVALEQEILDSGVNSAARIIFTPNNLPETYAFISIYVKRVDGGGRIYPRVYSGKGWHTLQPLDDTIPWLTSDYRRFGVYALLGRNSGGVGFSMTDGASMGSITRWHSPQIEQKQYPTPFTFGTRNTIFHDSSTDGYRTQSVNFTPRIIEDVVLSENVLDIENGQHVFLPHTNATINREKFAIELLAKPRTTTFLGQMVIGNRNSSTSRLYAAFRDDYYRVGAGYVVSYDGLSSGDTYTALDTGFGNSPWQRSGSMVKTDDWNHIFFNVDKSTATAEVFLNGELIETRSGWTLTEITSDLLLGKYDANGLYDYDGWIARPKLFRRNFNTDEVKRRYTVGASFDNMLNVSSDSIIESDVIDIDEVGDTEFEVYAKDYPTDGSNPVAGVYVDGVLRYDYSRSWHITVWDPSRETWATGINFYGATSIYQSVASARYDTYADRVNQSQAFANTLAGIPNHYIVIIAGSHHSSRFEPVLRDALLDYGASREKTGFVDTSIDQYILVGRKGMEENSAYIEVLSNLNEEENLYNGFPQDWAYAKFYLNGSRFLATRFAIESPEYDEISSPTKNAVQVNRYSATVNEILEE